MIKEFSNIIKNKRLEMNLSLRDLGELSDLDHSYIGRLEKGSSLPSRETVVKLAKALDLSVEELLVKAGYYSNMYQKWEKVIKKANNNKITPTILEKMIDNYIKNRSE